MISAGPLIIPSDKLSPKQGSVGAGSELGKNYSESAFNIAGQELSIPEVGFFFYFESYNLGKHSIEEKRGL